MKAACDGGAKVVVAAGFLQGSALAKAAEEFKDVNFVFIDGWPLTDAAGAVLTNVAPIAFQEEQCGYFAGYAVVKEGFTKLGFSGGGGGTNPACCRYGYGFVQGANAAAAEMGVNVDMMYSWLYGESYSDSPELQTMVNGWYENGTQIVFACGGDMFLSVTAAASANDGKVVGVDTDQSFASETVVTSALKGVSSATAWAINKFYDSKWAEIGGIQANLGVNDNSVGIPTETWSMKNFTVEQYNKVFEDVKAGTLVVDNDYANLEQTYSNLTLNIVK